MIKKFLLSHEPFKPMHVGNWVRGLYFKKLFPQYVSPSAFVLDVGCGNGRHSVTLHDMFPGLRIEGTDIKEFEDWKTFSSKKVSFHAADATKMNESERYDAVISIDMLEHIVDNQRVLASFFHALKPSGILYLGVPCESAEYYFFPQKYFEKFREWEKDEHIGEQRPLSELVALLKSQGYKVLLARYNFTAFGHLAWELEFILRSSPWGRRLNLILMPLYKLLGILDYYFPIGTGGNTIIAQKP
jgi:2-polyprenyl-3-methyl-5-hydroxy-6-metoxy-1,4-benzoquinol methylase